MNIAYIASQLDTQHTQQDIFLYIFNRNVSVNVNVAYIASQFRL